MNSPSKAYLATSLTLMQRCTVEFVFNLADIHAQYRLLICIHCDSTADMARLPDDNTMVHLFMHEV